MKVVALVPIKLNNERLPGKNTKLLSDGHPLMHHILSTLAAVPEIDESYVFCSDESIRRLVENLGSIFLHRDPSLDRSVTTSNEILHAFANVVVADVYVLAHATAPLITSASISRGLDAILKGDHDSALSVVELQTFYWIDGRPANYDPTTIPRTQDLDPILVETSGFYMFRREVLTHSNRRVGDNPHLVVVSKVEALDVDEPIDFEIVDAVIGRSTSALRTE